MLTNDPIDAVFGSQGAARVLLFLANYGEGYRAEIADAFGMSSSQVLKQLVKFEDVGLLESRTRGRTRIYSWKRGNPLARDLRDFLERILDRLPEEERLARYRERRRPRRTGKEP